MIDSTLISRRYSEVKKIKKTFEDSKVRYFFRKTNRQLEMIEVVREMDGQIWIFNYYFVNGGFVKLNKWNNRIPGDAKRAVANYYFLNNKLMFKDEHNTEESDLNFHFKTVAFLETNSPKFD